METRKLVNMSNSVYITYAKGSAAAAAAAEVAVAAAAVSLLLLSWYV